MEIDDRLRRLGGVARRTDVARTAAQRRALADAVRGSRIIAEGAWVALAGVDRAVVLARSLNATITCASAALYYGLATLDPTTRVHLAVPRSRGPRAKLTSSAGRAVIHRETSWRVPGAEGVPLAPITDVLARVLRCQAPLTAVVMVDSALNKNLVGIEELDRALIGPHSTRARRVLSRCDGRSRSAIETRARLLIEAAGMHVRAGVVIVGVGEVDLLVEDCVVVECDGFAYHSGRDEYREDRRRDRELVARGYLVLRFTWEEIMYFPDKVIEAVRRALQRPPQPLGAGLHGAGPESATTGADRGRCDG